MRILVSVKRVIDHNIRIRIKADGSGVETANVKMSMNPFDEIALEQAAVLREAGIATEVVAVSMGDASSQDTLRAALAVGADRAVHIETQSDLQPLAAAKLLAALALRERPRLALLGKQAIDDDSGQTGQMLAGLLGWSQGTFASRLDLDEDTVQITREIDGGLETLALTLPAVVTTDLRLNTPRYATLPCIMKARKKTIERLTPDDLGVDTAPRIEILKVCEPPHRKAGVFVENVEDLVEKLRNETRVIT